MSGEANIVGGLKVRKCVSISGRVNFRTPKSRRRQIVKTVRGGRPVHEIKDLSLSRLEWPLRQREPDERLGHPKNECVEKEAAH